MSESSTRRFYDELAADYHLIYADWAASVVKQGEVLDGLVNSAVGEGSRRVLDCACGIGTQAIGLAARGHAVIGTDLSPVAAARTTVEAAQRRLTLSVAIADMRALPFPDNTFDAVVCADNAIPHLLTADDMLTALRAMRRVLADGGLLILSTRPYDELRAEHQVSSPPWISQTDGGRAISFQLWHWHPDGERYDFEHFTLRPDGDSYTVTVRTATYWAITRAELAEIVERAGFADITWRLPEDSGFFQPLLTATARLTP